MGWLWNSDSEPNTASYPAPTAPTSPSPTSTNNSSVPVGPPEQKPIDAVSTPPSSTEDPGVFTQLWAELKDHLNPTPEAQARMNKSDPFWRMGPEMRDFLEQEAPIKPSNTMKPTPRTPVPESQKRHYDPTVYSKYGGKYAELWATYKPPEMVAAESRSNQAAILDVLMSFKERSAGIQRASMENCAFEQEDLHRCFATGMVKSLSGCSVQTHKLEKCMKAQQGFLKALGYMAVWGRSVEEEEELQIRADELWREQLTREKQLEDDSKMRETGELKPKVLDAVKTFEGAEKL